MLTRFPGTCSCGCGRAFKAGADVVRNSAGGWNLSSCSRPAPAPAPSTGYAASMAEVREILAQARAVAAKVTAPAQPLPPGLARGSRPADVEDAGRVLSF
jgi:hypothetical protein